MSGRAGKDTPHLVEFFALQFVAGRPRARKPAVHERQQVPAKLALICVAGEHLLWIARVNGQLSLPNVIAGAAEGTIQANLTTASVYVECDSALRRSFCSVV